MISQMQPKQSAARWPGWTDLAARVEEWALVFGILGSLARGPHLQA